MKPEAVKNNSAARGRGLEKLTRGRLDRLTLGLNDGGMRRGWHWCGPGNKCPGSTTSICWSRRSTCWSPGSGLCSIPCWFPLWGWPCTQAMSSCLSTSWRYCTTSRLCSDQDVTRTERLLGEEPPSAVGMKPHQLS